MDELNYGQCEKAPPAAAAAAVASEAHEKPVNSACSISESPRNKPNRNCDQAGPPDTAPSLTLGASTTNDSSSSSSNNNNNNNKANIRSSSKAFSAEVNKEPAAAASEVKNLQATSVAAEAVAAAAAAKTAGAAAPAAAKDTAAVAAAAATGVAQAGAAEAAVKLGLSDETHAETVERASSAPKSKEFNAAFSPERTAVPAADEKIENCHTFAEIDADRPAEFRSPTLNIPTAYDPSRGDEDVAGVYNPGSSSGATESGDHSKQTAKSLAEFSSLEKESRCKKNSRVKEATGHAAQQVPSESSFGSPGTLISPSLRPLVFTSFGHGDSNYLEGGETINDIILYETTEKYLYSPPIPGSSLFSRDTMLPHRYFNSPNSGHYSNDLEVPIVPGAQAYYVPQTGSFMPAKVSAAAAVAAAVAAAAGAVASVMPQHGQTASTYSGGPQGATMMMGSSNEPTGYNMNLHTGWQTLDILGGGMATNIQQQHFGSQLVGNFNNGVFRNNPQVGRNINYYAPLRNPNGVLNEIPPNTSAIVFNNQQQHVLSSPGIKQRSTSSGLAAADLVTSSNISFTAAEATSAAGTTNGEATSAPVHAGTTDGKVAATMPICANAVQKRDSSPGSIHKERNVTQQPQAQQQQQENAHTSQLPLQQLQPQMQKLQTPVGGSVQLSSFGSYSGHVDTFGNRGAASASIMRQDTPASALLGSSEAWCDPASAIQHQQVLTASPASAVQTQQVLQQQKQQQQQQLLMLQQQQQHQMSLANLSAGAYFQHCNQLMSHQMHPIQHHHGHQFATPAHATQPVDQCVPAYNTAVYTQGVPSQQAYITTQSAPNANINSISVFQTKPQVFRNLSQDNATAGGFMPGLAQQQQQPMLHQQQHSILPQQPQQQQHQQQQHVGGFALMQTGYSGLGTTVDVESPLDLMLLTSLRGVILYSSTEWKYLDLSREQLFGRPVEALMENDKVISFLELASNLNLGKAHESDVSIRCGTGFLYKMRMHAILVGAKAYAQQLEKLDKITAETYIIKVTFTGLQNLPPGKSGASRTNSASSPNTSISYYQNDQTHVGGSNHGCFGYPCYTGAPSSGLIEPRERMGVSAPLDNFVASCNPAQLELPCYVDLSELHQTSSPKRQKQQDAAAAPKHYRAVSAGVSRAQKHGAGSRGGRHQDKTKAAREETVYSVSTAPTTTTTTAANGMKTRGNVVATAASNATTTALQIAAKNPLHETLLGVDNYAGFQLQPSQQVPYDHTATTDATLAVSSAGSPLEARSRNRYGFARNKATTVVTASGRTVRQTGSNSDAAAGGGVSSAGNHVSTFGALGVGGGGGVSKKRARQAHMKAITESRLCRDCGVSQSPEWRRGPEGANTLCNACGLRYAKKQRSGIR